MTPRLKAYLIGVLASVPSIAVTPEMPEVDRVETISKTEKKVSLPECDTWSEKHNRYRVRATMSDRGAGKLWNNNCVFSPKVGLIVKGGSRVLANN